MYRRDPSQAPLEVGEHVTASLGPRVLRVELEFDRVEDARVVVLDLALVHLVGKRKTALKRKM
jgi:hypothetical protein